MHISHKSNAIQSIHETEWQCRRKVKGQTKAEYWTWLATITDADGVITYPSEDFTIVVIDDSLSLDLNPFFVRVMSVCFLLQLAS